MNHGGDGRLPQPQKSAQARLIFRMNSNDNPRLLLKMMYIFCGSNTYQGFTQISLDDDASMMVGPYEMERLEHSRRKPLASGISGGATGLHFTMTVLYRLSRTTHVRIGLLNWSTRT